MADLDLTLSTVALNVNELSFPVKRETINPYKAERPNYMLSLKDAF